MAIAAGIGFGAGMVVRHHGNRIISTRSEPTRFPVTGVAVFAGGTIINADGGNAHPFRNTPLLIHGRTEAGRPVRLLISTDSTGHWHVALPAGRYVAAVVTPLGVNPHALARFMVGQDAPTTVQIAESDIP